MPGDKVISHRFGINRFRVNGFRIDRFGINGLRIGSAGVFRCPKFYFGNTTVISITGEEDRKIFYLFVDSYLYFFSFTNNAFADF